MSTSKTQNYALHSWAPVDEFHVSEINENFSALDTALKAEADTAAQQLATLQSAVAQKAEASAVTALQSAVSAKADSATVSALQTAVNAKASASDLNALKTTVSTKADTSTVTALQNTVNTKASTSALNTVKADIPHYLTGSYAGTGSAVTVNLGVAPKVVVITTYYGNWYSTGKYQAYSAMAIAGFPLEKDALVITENGFSVKSTSNTNLTADGYTYYYWAWY